MPEYMVKVGHDQPLVDLVVVKARSAGIEYTRRVDAISGKIYEDAPFVELEITALQDAAMYLAELTKFGLNDADEENVTVYVRDDRWQWTRKNGIAKKPRMRKDATWTESFPRRIVILITDLEPAA